MEEKHPQDFKCLELYLVPGHDVAGPSLPEWLEGRSNIGLQPTTAERRSAAAAEAARQALEVQRGEHDEQRTGGT